jgi:hypothetical protein
VFKKNISDGVGSRNKSIDTPLYPPLFWLDNIFKGLIPNLSFFTLCIVVLWQTSRNSAGLLQYFLF